MTWRDAPPCEFLLHLDVPARKVVLTVVSGDGEPVVQQPMTWNELTKFIDALEAKRDELEAVPKRPRRRR